MKSLFSSIFSWPTGSRTVAALLVFAALTLFSVHSPAVEHISPLASKPDWTDLEPFQKTITRDDFLKLLNTVYAPGDAWKPYIDLGSDAATVHAAGKDATVEFRLQFARNAAAAATPKRFWVPPGARPVVPGKPLAGYNIALDPGHLGGHWAKMEERWFQIGNAKPVTEGDMALTVARLLATRLEGYGATVQFVRKSAEPVTSERPHNLRAAALIELKREGITRPRENYDGANDPLKQNSIAWESEMFFYRVSEIRHRAEVVNNRLRPDLVICLHFNAEDWGNPAQPQLTERNHLHLLVSGNCHQGELAFEDVRHDMLMKLLNRTARHEVPLSARVASSLATATGLPPFEYHNGKAVAVSQSPYVWIRNLLASRLYRCPVIYCEPYVMNSQPVFDRVQLGDYEGLKPVNGVARKSIYREYADAVAEGVAGYYASKAGK